MKSEQQVVKAIDMYADTVRRICMVHLKSYTDTEDIFQAVFLKYFQHEGEFESAEHEKAWLIRVTINACKDFLKSFWHNRTVNIDELTTSEWSISEENRNVIEAVLSLPEKYRDIVYLHYYEGYSAVEISQMLNKKVNTIYTLMARARNQLKVTLGGDDYEG